MAASNSTSDSGASLPGEAAPSAGPGAASAVNDIIVDGVVGGDTSVVRGDAGEATIVSEQASSSGPVPNVAALLPRDAEMLELAELLQGEHDGNLDALLTFTSDGTDTTIHVSAGGDGATQDQEIVLHGVGDLTAGGARSASVIIGDLLMRGTPGTDSM